MAAERARRSRAWLVADAVWFLLFVFSVVVQINDPDPFRWMLLYGLAAVACAMSIANRSNRWLPAALGVVALVWAATIAPRVLGTVRFLDMFGAFEMKNLGIEESREMYGLLLIAVWMTTLVFRAPTRQSKATG